jgi:excisionase family DNA binding protein
VSTTNDYVSISEAARLLGISRQTIHRLIDEGALTAERNPLYRPGRGATRIPRSQVEALAAKS